MHTHKQQTLVAQQRETTQQTDKNKTRTKTRHKKEAGKNNTHNTDKYKQTQREQCHVITEDTVYYRAISCTTIYIRR